MCESLQDPVNGYVLYSPDTTALYEFQTVASYRCNNGFGLRNGDFTRNCVNSAVSSGQWDGTAPECASKIRII